MAHDTTGQPGNHSASPPRDETPEQQLRRIVEQNPAHVDAWCQLGLLALRQDRHESAAESFARAAALDPKQPLVHHHLATSFQALGRREEAVHHFHQVVLLKPELAEAHNNWGIALARLGRHADAVAAFAQTLRLKPDYAEAHNNLANALFEQGQFAPAVDQFRQALALLPNYPEAHNNLALALVRLGRSDEAVAALHEAVRLRPDYPEAHHNLGNLQRDRNALEEAANAYRKVLKLRPTHRDARQHLALTLARQGRLEDAIACLHQSLLFHPDVPEVYNQLGVLFSQRDRLDEAEAAFRQAVRLRPEYPEGINNLGNSLLRQQKSDEAVRCFRQALQMRQDYPQPHCNLGSALMQQGKADEAVRCYVEALRLQPDYLDALFNLGNAYRTLHRQDEAVACYVRLLERQPDNAGARLNMGVALSEQGKLDEAVATYHEVLRRKPDFAEAYSSLGVTRLHQGRPADALAHFEEGLRLKPDDAEMHTNRALTWLAEGDYERGWVEYEWRWKLKKAAACPYPQPAWDGASLPNGTIVLWAEQGLGDTLQMVRYAPLVKERIGTVLLDCPAPLRGLLASCPGIDGLVGGGAPAPAADVQAPLMSLPRILGTTLSTVPAPGPYLFADGPLRERWREKLSGDLGLKVGLAWQGNPKFGGDRFRSVPLAQFRPLADVPGVRLFSLQKGKGTEQLPEFAEAWRITDLGGQLSGDFRDAAAAVANLDLVICVDTSVAHLTGALNVPLWVLLPFTPDWRWMRDRDDCIWYPGARLFRQERWGDWEGVFARVAEALRALALQPLRQRVIIQASLGEVLERAVREELRHGRPDECWAALRRAGVPDADGVAPLADKLRAAHATLDAVNREMQDLVANAAPDAQAANLVRRFVTAEKERADALAAFSALLARTSTASPVPDVVRQAM